MVLRKVNSIDAYFEILKNEPEETKTLFDDLLINVTDFFPRSGRIPIDQGSRSSRPSSREHRRPQALLRLDSRLLDGRGSSYSMAIALAEYLAAQDLDCPTPDIRNRCQ